MPVVARTTQLAAPAPVVWRHATTIAGINRELAPWMTMTVPPEYADLSLDDERVALGRRFDTVTFEPRLALAAPVARAMLDAFFAHRHRRLVSLFQELRGRASSTAMTSSAGSSAT